MEDLLLTIVPDRPGRLFALILIEIGAQGLLVVELS
jgi:hypothetical protein